MHALRLLPRFVLPPSRKRLSLALRDHPCRHALRERYLLLLIAILAMLVSSPRAACAITISTHAQAKVAATTTKSASAQQLSPGSTSAELRPLIPLSGLPILPAAVLWFPETDDLSDFRIAGVPDEPINLHSRSHRWIRIGMLVLFALGLIGMLFG